MASTVATKMGMSIFEKHMKEYEPKDPLYEDYQDEHGKKKRRRREIPPGLSARDARLLKKVKRNAHYLDKGFSICGIRFGWTAIIGLIPFAGDIADVLLNYLLVIRHCRKAEIPGWLLQRMLTNNAISAGLGFVPLVGDVLLATFKTNSRNAALLEEYLRIRGEEYLKAKHQRVEDQAVTKPGAGREPDEVIPGKQTGLGGTIKRFLGGGESSSAAAKNSTLAPAADTSVSRRSGEGSDVQMHEMPGGLKGKEAA